MPIFFDDISAGNIKTTLTVINAKAFIGENETDFRLFPDRKKCMNAAGASEKCNLKLFRSAMPLMTIIFGQLMAESIQKS
jgi:hypothetical protein